MEWALSRSVYHALAAATADARRYRYPQVTGAHLIAAFLDDPGSVVYRACSQPQLGATIKTALARMPENTGVWPPDNLPVGYADDVRDAVLGAESDAEVNSTTGHVFLRLLSCPTCEATQQLEAIGVDASALISSIAALVERGEQDQTPAAA
jgi:ATP-dependent Clp protease ATP-binding subunit ClpA